MKSKGKVIKDGSIINKTKNANSNLMDSSVNTRANISGVDRSIVKLLPSPSGKPVSADVVNVKPIALSNKKPTIVDPRIE